MHIVSFRNNLNEKSNYYILKGDNMHEMSIFFIIKM